MGSPLIKISPDVNDPNHREKDCPARKSPNTPTDIFTIKKHSDEDGAKYLSCPVYEIVEGASTNVEQGSIVVVKFYSSIVVFSFRLRRLP